MAHSTKERLLKERQIAVEHLELIPKEKERLIVETRINDIDEILKGMEHGQDATVPDSEEGSS